MFLSSMVPNVLYVVITIIIFITLSYPKRDEEGPLSEFLKAPAREPVFRKRKTFGEYRVNSHYAHNDFGPNSIPSMNWPYPKNMDPEAPNRVRRRIEDFTRGQNFNDEGINSS